MHLASLIPAFQSAPPLISHHQPRILPIHLHTLPHHHHRTKPHVATHRATMPAPLPTPTTHPPSVAGTNPVFAQCMLRINNPTASSAFYTALGMSLLTRLDFPDFKFSLFFYAYSAAPTPPLTDPQPARARWLWARPEPTIELTWNWPADTYAESLRLADAGHSTEPYVTANQPPMGFAYLQLALSDVGPAVAALTAAGVRVAEELSPHPDPDPAVTVVDPDGYHVRLTGPRARDTPAPIAHLDPVFDAVALRVKDPRSALAFFSRLGLRYLTRVDNHTDSSTEYYLAYTAKPPPDVDTVRTMRACKLKLLHVWGTEEEAEQMYANGNVKPNRGFGHVGVIVDDIYGTMEGLTEQGYKTVRKPGPFGDVGELAFVEEPSTSYWVEIIKREGQPAAAPYEQPVLG